MRFLSSRSDIALVKLTSPVIDLKPIEIYAHNDEKGKTITVFGRGATGDGIMGEDLATKPLRELHHFTNVVEKVEDNWLSFKFDKATKALALEGMHGSGDSGGASVIFKNKRPFLVGLTSWQIWNGDLASFKGGLYGTTGFQIRISSYRDWIIKTMSEN